MVVWVVGWLVGLVVGWVSGWVVRWVGGWGVVRQAGRRAAGQVDNII